MELQRCDLFTALNDPASSDTMSESSARAVLFDTLSALQYMHSQVGDTQDNPSNTLLRISAAQRFCRRCCHRLEPMRRFAEGLQRSKVVTSPSPFLVFLDLLDLELLVPF